MTGLIIGMNMEQTLYYHLSHGTIQLFEIHGNSVNV